METAKLSAAGLLLTRATILRKKLKSGISIPEYRIPADEFEAMMIIEEEIDIFEREKADDRQ